MWYVFKGETCVASCDSRPDTKDLAKRGEKAIRSNALYSVADIELINGQIQPKQKSEEEKMQLIRQQRDDLLAETDWTDTLSAKTRLGEKEYNAWQEYRQALRDLPANCDLDNPVWPKPEVR